VTEKKLRSRKEFVRSLLNLMTKKEYESITISDICKHAGYNRGTFYQYFYDKDDLLNKIIDSKLKEMVATLIQVYKGSTEGKTVESLGWLFEFMENNAPFFRVVLKENKIIGFRYKMFLSYREYLSNSLKNPITLADPDPEIDDFYLMFASSASLGIMIYFINEGFHKSPQYIAEEFSKIFNERPHGLLLGKESFRKSVPEEAQQEMDPRIFRTKQALKDALLLQLKQKEYQMIKVNDITNEADYNRSTFYSHYRDKNELYEEIISDFIKGLKSAVRKKNQKDFQTSPLDHLFAYVYNHRTLLEIMYSDKKVPGFFNYIYTNLVDDLLEELEGRLDVDTEIYAHYIISALMSTIGQWISTKVKYSPSYLSKLFTKFLLKPPIRNNQFTYQE
jgi:AcrR family transcriptional regulator